MWTNSAMKAYEEQIMRETLVRRDWEKRYDPRFAGGLPPPPPPEKPARVAPPPPDVSESNTSSVSHAQPCIALYTKHFKGEARPVDLVYPPSVFTKELEQQEGYVNLRGEELKPKIETYRSAPGSATGTGAALGASLGARSDAAEPAPAPAPSEEEAAVAAAAAAATSAGDDPAGSTAGSAAVSMMSAVLSQTQPRSASGQPVLHGVYLRPQQPYPDLGPGYALYARAAAPSNLDIPGYQGPMDHALHMRMYQSTQFVEERLLRTGKNPYAQDL
eukprot:tig00020952_g16509.t1